MTDIVERLRENADLDAAEHVPDDVVQMQYEAADEIERLRTEVDTLRADAERYRWLRKWINDGMPEQDEFVESVSMTNNIEEFDAAVDAAIREMKD